MADEGDSPSQPAAEEPPADSAPPPPTPAYVTARAIQTASLRTEPSTLALITSSIPAGTVVTVLGCSSGCQWLLVQTPGGGTAWSAAFFYSVQGSLQGISNR